MDSLTTPILPAPATPREAPLAMPVQSLRRFGRDERRAWAAAQLARTPWPARLFIFGGAFALTFYGAREMYGVVEVGVVTPLEWALVVLFVLTFSWIALAFTSSLVGFAWLVAWAPRAGPLPQRLEAKTAVVMPIYNEAPSRVFSAMQAIYEDVAATGLGDAFDYFFLSDTTDPDIWIAEERALLAMRQRLPGARDLLPAPSQERRPQGRQYRRFRHALGRRLSADGGARRRQPDDRRRDRAPRRGDGGRSRRGNLSEPAADRQPQHAVRQGSTIRRAHRRPDHLAGAGLAAWMGRDANDLGPQRTIIRNARLRRPLRPAGAGGGRRWAATS